MRGWLYRRRVRRLVAIYGRDTARWHKFVIERARTRAADEAETLGWPPAGYTSINYKGTYGERAHG